MRIVITGASGNVGTALLRCLEDVHEVVGVARRVPDHAVGPYSRADWHSVDIGEPGADRVLADLFAGADAVVHLAWGVSPAREDPPMSRTNADGTANVLEAVQNAGVGHLVCASSVAAYSPAPRDDKVGEEWPCHGIAASAYSRGKAELETELDQFVSAHPQIRVARMRPCAVLQRQAAGEFARWSLGPALPPRLIGSRFLPIPAWAGLRVQAVHADDLAEALRLVLDQRAVGPFNIAADDVLDSTALAHVLGGTRLPVTNPVARTATRAAWLAGLLPLHPGWLELADQAPLVDATRARLVLGWIPRHSSADAVRDLVEGLRRGDGAASAPLAVSRPGLLGRVKAMGTGRPTRQSQA
ncbi:NAD-dependent epimerase/dehydratase family protein [Amycolatopsis benzoatilytica]|uniref:NAD-dependent epimerase/dehydratase family protein n=1 Tax=Amycolatopsis benzoatilytica TaxID=346045 RepID=UPI000379A882|nr:NAD-dependent epimerase/dehydratase family protein [Amycolatopsis benzoatilytica]